ncbi:MAG: hypothetical protein HRU28_17135 [Rhizobiales bacterium]|nr:hypothetical protein [Hyphomicrobiales bacterium]
MYTLLFLQTYAQQQPNIQTTKLVNGITKAFFEQLLLEEFTSERAFMSDQLANSTTIDDWRNIREKIIKVSGSTPRYVAHGLTYYQGEKLLAAVDFSSQTLNPNIVICGYLLWELPSPNKIELTRFEQNIVSVDLFRAMPQQKAAQLMTNW